MDKEIDDFVKNYVEKELTFWLTIKNMGFTISKRFKVINISSSRNTGSK